MRPAPHPLLTLAGLLTCLASCSCSIEETAETEEIPVNQETLLIGGDTGTYSYTYDGYDDTTSYSQDLELITEHSTCSPAIPEAPVGRQYAAAAFLPETETILYCGGQGGQTPAYHAECHTLNLKKSNSTWEVAPSMNHPRGRFTLEVVEGKAYAIGGDSDLGLNFTGPTVEVFTPGGEWEISTEMQMPSYREYHCSTTLGNRIVVIGGHYGTNYSSPSVIQYDMDHKAKGWTHLTNTHYGRRYHACQQGSFQGQRGIYVAGGSNSGDDLVEFYVDVLNKWRKLPSLTTYRKSPTMSLLAGSLFVHGGDETTQEVLNGTWTTTFNLTTARSSHTSVSLPAATLKCT